MIHTLVDERKRKNENDTHIGGYEKKRKKENDTKTGE